MVVLVFLSQFYYTPRGESAENLALMRRIDELFLCYPFYGSRQMVRHLFREGIAVGRHRVRRLMRRMGLEAIYRAPKTSTPHPEHRVYPYLLRNMVVTRPEPRPCLCRDRLVRLICRLLLHEERACFLADACSGKYGRNRPQTAPVGELIMQAKYIKSISMGGRSIGPGHPCFIIAEVGVNHNGDFDLARRLVDVAVEAGVDAVKFQTGDPKRVVSDSTPKAEYQRVHTGTHGTMMDVLKDIVLSYDNFARIKEYCDSAGMLFLSTPFDLESVDFLVSLGMPAVKVPSGEITNVFLLRKIASKRLPVLLSTGMATLCEIAGAVDMLRGHGSGDIAVFQCVSNYPATPEGMNLRSIPSMSQAFGIPCGFSDHSLGIEIAMAAVALGANMLEKHFTLDRSMLGPDHAMSLEPEELKGLVRATRDVEAALGDGVKRLEPQEVDVRRVARRSLAAARDIKAGTIVAYEDFFALRPSTGLAPADVDAVIGRRAIRDIQARSLISMTDFN